MTDERRPVAVALLSGGLDSTLAAKVILEQGITVVGINFAGAYCPRPFAGKSNAEKAAEMLGIKLVTLPIDAEFVAMVKRPKHGRGKNMNPCIDCHTLMIRKAWAWGQAEPEAKSQEPKAKTQRADFVITGEVLGQRPMSQNRNALNTVAKDSGVGDRLVRPMSAKLGLKFVPEQPEAGVILSEAKNLRGAGREDPSTRGKPLAQGDKGGGVFGPEDVFHYIYAIFHSPTYRKRYAEFLKIDFPRVPLTSDKKLFWNLVALGRELVALHLLESPKVNDFVTKYPKKGSDTVEKVQFAPSPQSSPSRGEEAKAKRGRSSIPSPLKGEGEGEGESGRIYINSEQYFEGVKPDWFEFHIGGYQVLQKWLKDRKGRKLTNDDITHYQRVVVAIKGSSLFCVGKNVD